MSKKSTAPPQVCNVIPDLKQFLVPIDSVFPDPTNANLHPDRNVSAIAASLNAFGQRTLIVCLEEGRIIKKGNGTLEAARRLGWTHIAAVFVRESHTSATAYAIADNQSGKLAEWDYEVLTGQFKALKEDGFDLTVTGFTREEMDSMAARSFEPTVPPFIPDLEGRQYTDEDMEKGEEHLKGISNTDRTGTDVVCPKCGHNFSVDGI